MHGLVFVASQAISNSQASTSPISVKVVHQAAKVSSTPEAYVRAVNWLSWDKQTGFLSAVGLELGVLALAFGLIVYLSENSIALPFHSLWRRWTRPNLQDVLVVGFCLMVIALGLSFASAFVRFAVWQDSVITLIAGLSVLVFIILSIRAYVVIRDNSLRGLADQNILAMEAAASSGKSSA